MSDETGILTEPLLAAFALDSAVPTNKQSGNVNVVYRCRRVADQAEVFVRVTSLTHRTARQVEAEIAFQEGLAASGIPVAKPLRTKEGTRVLCLGNQGLAVCFESVRGRAAVRPSDFTANFVRSWALLLARLHSHSEHHAADFSNGPESGREDWSDDAVLRTALEDRALETAEFSNLLRQQISWIQRLSRSERTFGLTHADLQISNIHVIDSGVPSLAFFDLDDCCFHYFVHDLAVACTQLRKAGIETAGAVDAASLEEHLITCYASARGFSAEEEAGLRATLPEFVKYRAALVMCWASEERKRGTLSGPVGEAWFTGSLPIYRQLVRLPSLCGSGGEPLAPQDSRHGLL